jgi:ribosome-associated toxin RatA of RatAB toxin-antitoxin module
MMRDFICSITIDADIQKVYEIAETYPHFVTFYDVKETLLHNDEKIDVRVGYRIFGILTTWTGYGNKYPPREIKYVQVRGILKNMTADWRFTKSNANTTVEVHINLKKTALGLFLVRSAKETTKKILNELKNAVENRK